MRTNQGNIIIKLAFDKAPLTVSNFVGLAEGTKHSALHHMTKDGMLSVEPRRGIMRDEEL
jgi:cyclophilin family peptidyl-prolyl cis-trans isomerase